MKTVLSLLFVCTALVANNAQADSESKEDQLESNLIAKSSVEIAGNKTRLNLPFEKARDFFCNTIAKNAAKNGKPTSNDPQVAECSEESGSFSVTFPLSFSYRLKWMVEEVAAGRAVEAPEYSTTNKATFSFSPDKEGLATLIELTPDSVVWGYVYNDAVEVCAEEGKTTCPKLTANAKVENFGANNLQSMALKYSAFSDDEETYQVDAFLSEKVSRIKYRYEDDEFNGEEYVEYTGGPGIKSRVEFQNPYYVDMKPLP